MSEVKLLDIEEIEHEVFTRSDITGYQVNRHLLSNALTGTRTAGPPLPVTEAARDAYRQVTQDGWETHDITALVECGWRSP